MPRVKLPTTLPPQTESFRRFEQTNVELNRYYWTFKCSIEYFLANLGTAENITDLVSGNSGAHLNITTQQFANEATHTERVARHSLLVLSVTSFEDYLKDILTTFLIGNWKEDKTYKISFRPQDLPPAQDLLDYLKSKSVDSIVTEHLNKGYSKRFEAISTLLVAFQANRPILGQDMQDLASQACEARNCIVHSGGTVDSRTADTLQGIIPGIRIGDDLDVSESLLWQFLGSLRDTARAIDVELRNLI